MRLSLDSRVLFSLVLPLAMAACDGNGGNGGSGGEAGAGGNGAGGAGGGQTTTTSGTTTSNGGQGGGQTTKCEEPGYGGNEVDVAVGVVSATLIDQNGAPAANAAVQVCGTDICLYENAGATGKVTVNANKTLKKPAFKYGDGITFAKLAALLPAGDSNFGEITTGKLPDVGDGDPFSIGGSVKSAGMTIEIASGGSFEVDFLLYPEDVDQVFRAVEVPTTNGIAGLEPSLGIEMVFGVAPLETVFCPPAKIRLPNTPAWAANADVEIFIQGVDALQHWAPYGEWLKVSDAKVSSDGSEVVTVDGQGLPVLSTLGARLKK